MDQAPELHQAPLRVGQSSCRFDPPWTRKPEGGARNTVAPHQH